MFEQFADNEDLQAEWKAAKMINKMRVVSLIKEKTGYIVSPNAMFDVQVRDQTITVIFSQLKNDIITILFYR